MLINLKALVVVLLLATPVFILAKPLCLRFTSPEDFARRRIVWYVLTVCAFVSPSFWLYALVAVPVLAWAGKRDASPTALYVLMFYIVPHVSIDIPAIGISRLFDLSQARLLGLLVLLPAVLAQLQSKAHQNSPGWTSADLLLLMYGALQLVLLIPYESATNSIRRTFLFLLDDYLIYHAFSRIVASKSAMVDTMGTVALSAALLAPMAVFESMRHWLLYTGIPDAWGSPNEFAWLFRGETLRAQVSTGHAIPLGYLMAIGIGCWLALMPLIRSRSALLGTVALLSVALVFSYSRGAWLTAVIAVLVLFALGSRSAGKFATWSLGAFAVSATILMSPLGAGILENLPIVGSVGQDTVDYRQQLAETSWRLIQLNPWFGNPFVVKNMEELRQGQGIIDLVNAYASVALFYGLVGLSLFVGVFAVVLAKGYFRFRRARAEDLETVLVGAGLIGCMLATLIFMGTAGFARMQWQLAGLLASYAALRMTAATVSGAAARAGAFRRSTGRSASA